MEMITVGMLYHSKHPRHVTKAYNCAAVAKMVGIQFFYFSPENVRFEEKMILGYIYENGQWLPKEMPFPDIIYNPSHLRSLSKTDVYCKLKSMIPFTSHPIGDKIKVFKKIQKMPEFAHYLIPSEVIEDSEQVTQALDQFRKIVVKPLAGRQGQKVIFIEQNGDQFDLLEGTTRSTVSEAELHSMIKSLTSEMKFLVQPFISSRTKEGNPFDFRLHVQKNGEGKWSIASIHPRIGSKDGIISNVHTGGYTGKLPIFLSSEFGDEQYDIQKRLEHFALKFSEQFEKFYKNPLDELGIDIGIDEDKKLWIYEVNTLPGCLNRELDVAKNTIPYAVYLARQHKNKE